MLRGAAVAVAVLAIVATVACGGSDGAPAGPSDEASLTVRDDGAGGVTVQATWVTPAHLEASDDLEEIAASYAGRDVALVHLKLDTHSVDLSNVDLAAQAELDVGATSQRPLAYHALSGAGHHVDGVLVFEAPPSGAATTLVVRDVAGVPVRRLAWTALPFD